THWGTTHHNVCQAAGESARDHDGDGSSEVHVNALEGFWSRLRSWLRPHCPVLGSKNPRLPGDSFPCVGTGSWSDSTRRPSEFDRVSLGRPRNESPARRIGLPRLGSGVQPAVEPTAF